MSSSSSSKPDPLSLSLSAASELLTQRREFLGQLAAAAVVLAGTGCAAPAVASSQATAPTPDAAPAMTMATTPASKTVFDDSWVERLTAKHKAVFDSPEIQGGVAIYQAQLWASGFKEMYHLADSDT